MNQMGQNRLILILFWGPESALPNVQHKAFRKRKKVLFLKKVYKAIFSTGANDWLQSHSWTVSSCPDNTFARPVFHDFRFKTKLVTFYICTTC